MRTFEFVQLDVFTQQPLQGNQLAVFTDARGLSDPEMQRLAKETNLSETTFIFPQEEATEQRDGVKVRIFTVEEELPFAGHPTLGTAAVIRTRRNVNDVTLDLKVGKIPVRFTPGEAALAYGEMRQRDPEFGQTHPAAQVAKIAGLSESDLRDDVPIQTVSTGNAFVIVPIKTLAAIQRIRLDAVAANEYLARTDGKFFYFISLETTVTDSQVHARMLFYNGEDSATGSAAGPAIAWLVKYGLVGSEKRVMIEQGVEMGRRSHIFVSAKKADNRITDVRVGGYAIEVARGQYLLP
jgi:trans-2,3-dihydro-3-hydroxyanthranilate isomerase